MPRSAKSKMRLICLLAMPVMTIVCLTAQTINAQCARPGFKLTDAFLDSSLGYEATTADFNSDGKLDVAMISQTTSRVSILLGDGEGNLGAPTTYTVGPEEELTQVFAAHINTDGKPDLVILGTAYTYTSASVLINNGTGGFGGVSTTGMGYIWDFKVGDITGDGRADLVTTVLSGTITGYIRVGDGTGQFSAPSTMSVSGSPLRTLIGDFNGDTRNDLAVYITEQSNYRVQLFLNNGLGGLTAGAITAFGTNLFTISATGDFNGDNKLDIAALSYPSGVVTILTNNGSGGFSRTDYPVISQYKMFVGDFDGNGSLDILTFNQRSGSFLFNNGSGGFTRSDSHKLPTHPDGDVGDFNGDGKTDILYPSTSHTIQRSGTQVWLRTCNATAHTKYVDYFGDGITEAAVWRPSNGHWIVMSGSQTYLTRQWGLGSLGDVPVPGDYDGDEITDLTVFRAPAGVWYVLRSSDGTALGIQWGASGDKPVPGDYDADGKTDFAVWRPSNGTWYILKSSDNTLAAYAFGTNGDKPAQADFDNDDKTDIAIFRPSNGFWYILRSSDGSFNAEHFGNSNDKPVPGDYDGDGDADIAVFRAGEAWYFKRSYNNVTHGTGWGQTMIPAPGVFHDLGIMDVANWEPSTGRFHIFSDSTWMSVGTFGDIPVTSPYVVE